MSLLKKKVYPSEGLSINTLISNGVIITLLLYLFYPLAVSLIQEWRRDPEFSHGFLIPLVSVYLVWMKRKDILLMSQPMTKISEGEGLILLICGLIVFVFSRFLQHMFIEGVALVIILLGIVLFLYGKKVMRTVQFPIIYLVFMLPIPYTFNYFIAQHLKFSIAKSAGFLLGIFQIPVFLDKNVLQLASISLEVVEACSGMQTTISFLAIGSLFAYLTYNSNVYRMVIVFLAIPMALIANIVRVSMIGILSHYFNNDVALKFHGYAWVLVVFTGIIGFALLRFCINLLIERNTHKVLFGS
jgi:exosortase